MSIPPDKRAAYARAVRKLADPSLNPQSRVDMIEKRGVWSEVLYIAEN